jgi:hypothetical protein
MQEVHMTEPNKAKPKKGNPTWPTGKPKPLSAIDGKARKLAGLKPGGAWSWPGLSQEEARRQGQLDLLSGHRSVDPSEEEVKQANRRRERLMRQPGVSLSPAATAALPTGEAEAQVKGRTSQDREAPNSEKAR